MVHRWIGPSRLPCAGLMERQPSWAAFNVLAERAAPPASYATRERRLPSTAAAAPGLCCLLAGQPLCHHERPEAAFLWRVRRHRRRAAPADDRSSTDDAGSTVIANVLVGQLRPKPEPGCLSFVHLRSVLTSKELWVELWTTSSQAAFRLGPASASPPLAVWRRELRHASCQTRASIYSSTPYVHEFRSIAALRAVCTQKR